MPPRTVGRSAGYGGAFAHLHHTRTAPCPPSPLSFCVYSGPSVLYGGDRWCFARSKLRSHRSQLLGVLRRLSFLIDCSVVVQLLRMLHDYVRSIVQLHENICTLCDLSCTSVRPLYKLVETSISRATLYDGHTNPLRLSTMKKVVGSCFWILNMLTNQHQPVCKHFHSQDCLQQVRPIVRSSWDHLWSHHNFGCSLSQTGRNAYVTGPLGAVNLFVPHAFTVQPDCRWVKSVECGDTNGDLCINANGGSLPYL